MPDVVSDTALEERKIALEERKLENEIALRKLEWEMKTRESGWFAKQFTPLTATLLAGILTLASSALGIFLQGRSSLLLETQKEQHELILKMINVSTVEQAKQNIDFLAETGLIADKTLADKILATKTTPLIPSPVPEPSNIGHFSRPGCDVAFVRAPTADNPLAIRFLNDWDVKNITTVHIPQLSKVPGGPASGIIRFNVRGTEPLKAAWAEIEQEGLLDRVVSWEGSYVPRTTRTISGSSNSLSVYACGLTFNINVQFNAFGRQPALKGQRGSVLELVPIFEKHGFKWGGNFKMPQGFYFEYIVSENTEQDATKQ